MPELVKTYAETVVALEHQHSFVVHGSGLDEVALHGETQVAEIKNGKIEYFTLTPEDFGLKTQSIESLRRNYKKMPKCSPHFTRQRKAGMTQMLWRQIRHYY